MPGLDWLTARPIAHRGLHDASAAIENTATAFTRAIAGGYGIECDLQVSADGEAMVHHDDALGRLTEGSGRLADLSAAEIKKVRFKQASDRILTLAELCELIAGRATLVLELKSHFDGDRRLVERAAAVLANYQGPVAAMSFDPAMVETAAPHRARASPAASSPNATTPITNGTACRRRRSGGSRSCCMRPPRARNSSPTGSATCRRWRRSWRGPCSACRC